MGNRAGSTPAPGTESSSEKKSFFCEMNFNLQKKGVKYFPLLKIIN